MAKVGTVEHVEVWRESNRAECMMRATAALLRHDPAGRLGSLSEGELPTAGGFTRQKTRQGEPLGCHWRGVAGHVGLCVAGTFEQTASSPIENRIQSIERSCDLGRATSNDFCFGGSRAEQTLWREGDVRNATKSNKDHKTKFDVHC